MLMNIQQVVIIFFLSVVAFTVGTGASAAGPVQAVAVISGCNDDHIEGSAKFIERQSDEGVKIVDVSINVRGLSPGMHAVHIHETGNCTPCSEAKGHFDPGPHGFTSPDGNHPFHSGDLVNLEVHGIWRRHFAHRHNPCDPVARSAEPVRCGRQRDHHTHQYLIPIVPKVTLPGVPVGPGRPAASSN